MYICSICLLSTIFCTCAFFLFCYIYTYCYTYIYMLYMYQFELQFVLLQFLCNQIIVKTLYIRKYISRISHPNHMGYACAPSMYECRNTATLPLLTNYSQSQEIKKKTYTYAIQSSTSRQTNASMQLSCKSSVPVPFR